MAITTYTMTVKCLMSTKKIAAVVKRVMQKLNQMNKL
jgi:hypothetical protein